MQANLEKQKQQKIAELEKANNIIASKESELSAANIRLGICETSCSVDAMYLFQLRKYDGRRQVRRRLSGGQQQITMEPSYTVISDYSHLVVDLWLFNNGGLPTTMWDFRLSMKIDDQMYVGEFIPEAQGCYINREFLPGQALSLERYSQPPVDMEITSANPLTRSSPRRCWVHFAFHQLRPFLYRAVICDLEYRDATQKCKYTIQADLVPTEIHQDG